MKPPPMWIIGSPRTGTTTIANSLNAAYGYSPEIDEWLNKGVVGHGFSEHNLPTNCKAFPVDMENLGISLHDVDEAIPGVKWLLFRRRDLARQIASFWYSVDSGLWHSYSKADSKAYSRVNLEISEGVVDWMKGVLEYNDRVSVEFCENEDHIEVWYEDILEDVEFQWKRVVEFLGVDSAGFVDTTVRLSNKNRENIIPLIREMIGQ